MTPIDLISSVTTHRGCVRARLEGGSIPAADARLMPNRLTLVSTEHHRLAGVPICHDVDHR
jgi:hypothetical protein